MALPIPAAPLEPSPALKNALNLRVEPETSEGARLLLAELGQRVLDLRRAKAALHDWEPIYQTAIDALVRAQADLDARTAELLARTPAADEPTKVHAVHAGEPKKEAEAARTRIKAELKRVTEEWKDRLKRQCDEQFVDGCLKAARASLKTAAHQEHKLLKLRVSEEWRDKFNAYLERFAAAWKAEATESIEAMFRQAAGAAASVALARRAGIKAPAMVGPQPATDSGLEGTGPEEEPEVPSRLELVIHALRADLMIIVFIGGLVGTLSGVVLYAMKQANKIARDSQWGTLMTAAFVPVGIVLAVRSSATHREKLVAKATAEFKKRAEAWVKESVTRSAQRHLQRLQQWLGRRLAAWESAVDEWYELEVAPAARLLDAEAERRASDLKAQIAASTAEVNGLRMFRSKLQTIATELRKRTQEIQDEVSPAAAAAPP